MVCEKEIFQNFDEISIAEIFIKDRIKLNKAILSPFRDEKRASFSFYKHKMNGRLWWKDHSLGIHGNVVDLVKIMYGVDYKQALKIISENLHIPHSKISHSKRERIIENKYIVKKLKFGDFEYYKLYNIEKEFLDLYGIKEVFSIYNKNRGYYSYIKEGQICYGYQLSDKWKFNIPNSDNRFFGNMTKDLILGIENIDFNNKILIITKSIKDVILLKQIGFNSIAFQSELIIPNSDYLGSIINHYQKVYILFDNDSTGINASNIFANEYGVIPLTIPLKSKCKDITDISKMYGIEICKQLMKKLLK